MVEEQQKPVDQLQPEYLDKINQELYKRNYELAVRNKTLSLLRDLYAITIESLATDELGKEIVRTLRKGLGFELVGLFVLNEDKTILNPIALSISDHSKETVTALEQEFMKLPIKLVDMSNIANEAIVTKQQIESESLLDVWKPLDQSSVLEQLNEVCNIRTSIVYPLINDAGPIGVLVCSINRTYNELSQFEHQSIESVIDVITIALDKSLLYDQLRVANQKLRELDVAKSEFMSIASHQLRTPLAGIVGYLSMLVEGDYGDMVPEQKEVIKEIFTAGQRLVRLVNTFLNVTRIEAGRFTINFSAVDITAAVAAEVKELQPTANKKGLKLSYIAPAEKIMAQVDGDKIRDVFLNLIDNAIKYTPHGSVTVSVTQADNQAQFIVSDTGIGIDHKEAQNLFEKFVRGTGIARIQPNGSGLGLYIVKKIVEAHGGKVWVESEGVEKGSTFHAQFPLEQSNNT